jgi:hypothetical protein
LPFRREERLGCLARIRDPPAIITAKVVLLLPVVEQELPQLFEVLATSKWNSSTLASRYRIYWVPVPRQKSRLGILESA